MKIKFYIFIILLVSIFSYIDQPCNAGNNGKGVCVKRSSCKLYGNQVGKVISYEGSSPNWPCPNDPADVICCVKEVTRLRDGTYKSGRCLNINQCKTSTVNTYECPGTNNVKLCVTNSETVVNSVYKINANTLNIRNGDDTSYNIVGTISSGQYIFVTTISSNGWAKFYKGYVSGKYITKVNSNVNYKVNTEGLNFRTGPGQSYNKLATLNNGYQIVYYSRDPWNNNWAVTNKGYCSASYIAGINVSPTPTPTPTPTPSPTNAGAISTKFDGTILSRDSFINKVKNYCTNHPAAIATALCNNAGTVYDISKSSNVNAFLLLLEP